MEKVGNICANTEKEINAIKDIFNKSSTNMVFWELCILSKINITLNQYDH